MNSEIIKREKQKVSSGTAALDRLIGGLFIGDNVVWHDNAGSLSPPFCQNFLRVSMENKRPVYYVTFDRSPRNLLEKLGPLAENSFLTIVDCFTHGKGAGSGVFLKFYHEDYKSLPCRIIRIKEPHDIPKFTKTFYGLFENENNDVRFIFESLSGMQEIWGGEEHVIDFYSHSCPRLYELNTIAYWIMEKNAHLPRTRARINQIAQVALELSARRGRTSLTVLKAEDREAEDLNKPHYYRSVKHDIAFDAENRCDAQIELGIRMKNLRKSKGVSQTELARMVGLTPGTISQVESGQIYPSLPALLRIAEMLSVDLSCFFTKPQETANRVVFHPEDAVEVRLPNLSSEIIKAKLLAPFDFETRAEPYLIEISPQASLSSHFFMHKGEEVGYLLKGRLRIDLAKGSYTAGEGELIYLTNDVPLKWKNAGDETARILWLKIN